MNASPDYEVSDEEQSDALPNGTALFHGQYSIESFLSCGGFGVTYLARDSLERRVVIKECFPRASCRREGLQVVPQHRVKDEDFRAIVRLFVDEARNLAKLDHPNIVGVHQVFEDNGTAYMALDYIRGRELLEVIDEGLLTSAKDVRRLLDTLLDTVDFIHGRGILHRDISPDNILIRQDMSPVLIDFGAARADAMSRDRRTAILAVKDGYSPQEFYIGGSQQDPSSDLYSLAASFHHLLVGEPPLPSSERLAEVAAKLPDPQPSLIGRVNGFDDRFLSGIDRALQVLQKNRFGSASDWKAHLSGKNESPSDNSLAEVLVRRRMQLEEATAQEESEAEERTEKPRLKVVTAGGKVRSAPNSKAREKAAKANASRPLPKRPSTPATSKPRPKSADLSSEPAAPQPAPQLSAPQAKLEPAKQAGRGNLLIGGGIAAALCGAAAIGYAVMSGGDSATETTVAAVEPAPQVAEPAAPAAPETAAAPAQAETDPTQAATPSDLGNRCRRRGRSGTRRAAALGDTSHRA